MMYDPRADPEGLLRGRYGEREPITVSQGGAPSGVQGQSPWSGEAKPP